MSVEHKVRGSELFPLLIVNFAMDLRSPVLAWQAKVAAGLADRFPKVLVLTHLIGEVPSHARLDTRRFPRWIMHKLVRPLGGGYLMSRWIAREIDRVQARACFIHMHMQWAIHLKGLLRRKRIPMLLWYAHGTVTPELERAHEAVNRVVTSTPEGFRIPSEKVYCIGQAIDTHLFCLPQRKASKLDVVYVGRISPRKRVLEIVDCFHALRRKAPGTPFRLRLIGPLLTEADQAYAASLQQKVASLGLQDCVLQEGPMRMDKIPEVYETAFAHLNLSETGSMDKTVMEALACGCPAFATGEAYREALRGMPGLILAQADPDYVAEKLWSAFRAPDSYSAAGLRALVAGKHDLDHYLDQLTSHLVDLRASTPVAG